MFMARHRRSARGSSARSGPAGPVSGRRALWVNTLERRYDFHLGEAIRAAIEGSHDKATKHSGTALSISRELYAGAPDPARHQPELAAALCTHARYRAGWQAIAMLAESAGHYAELAEADPAVYEVARIDVLTRVALASDEAGNTAAAVGLLREVIGMYLKAPAADPEERDIGLARARFQLGRCLLATGQPGRRAGGDRYRARAGGRGARPARAGGRRSPAGSTPRPGTCSWRPRTGRRRRSGR